MKIRQAALWAGLCVGLSYGQQKTPALTMPVTVENVLPNQQIGVNDLLSVTVSDCPELTRAFRVSTDGTLPLPMLRKRIRAAGLYPTELEESITKALQAEDVLVAPVVSVAVMEYRSRPVKVVGAVRHPLTFQAIGEMSLLDALGRADGLSPEAGPEILLSRLVSGSEGQPVTQVQHIPVKALLGGTDEMMNPKLVGGEEIRVPEAGRVYVAGNVKKPGMIALRDAEDLTVLKALAISEGLIPYYEKLAYIYRPDPLTGEKAELPIELARIVDRKAADVPLRPNDILYVPDNRGRRLTMGTLEKLAGFGSSTASGILIWRH